MQLVVTIITLIKGSVDLVKTSLLGTVLSKLMLIVDTRTIIGGIDRLKSTFQSGSLRKPFA